MKRSVFDMYVSQQEKNEKGNMGKKNRGMVWLASLLSYAFFSIHRLKKLFLAKQEISADKQGPC